MDWVSPVVLTGVKRIPTDAAEVSEVGLVNCFVSCFPTIVGFLGKLRMALWSWLSQDWLLAPRLVQDCRGLLQRRLSLQGILFFLLSFIGCLFKGSHPE